MDLISIDGGSVTINLHSADLGALILACRAASTHLDNLAPTYEEVAKKSALLEVWAALFESLAFASDAMERARAGPPLTLGQVVNEWQPPWDSIVRE